VEKTNAGSNAKGDTTPREGSIRRNMNMKNKGMVQVTLRETTPHIGEKRKEHPKE
jgi:hypothetical protein